MNLTIIKYNAGNVRSVTNALHRLGVEPLVSDDPDEIRKADKIIFPGVGEARTAMQYLRKTGLDTLIPTLTQPFLGICLGLQLMCAHTEENNTDCLGIFPLTVKRFPDSMKVPHMGWNEISHPKGPLMKGVDGGYLYFVHSYYAPLAETTIARAGYSLDFSAALQQDNFFAIQAHPEKSSHTGQQILKNFIEI